MGGRSHAIYLAIIAVLILAIVYAVAKAIRVRKILADVEEQFGLSEDVRASALRKGGKALRHCGADVLLRPRTYAEYRKEVDTLLERAQALEEFGEKTRLAEACQAALRGGKRLRSIILLEVARAASASRSLPRAGGRAQVAAAVSPVDAAEAALFVEYIHAASLVVDDLPAFDDDLERRGQPTLHVTFGPALAQMAAVTLMAAAFHNVCRQIDWIRDNCPEIKNADRIGTRICSEASRALGAIGAASGQYMDVTDAAQVFREYGPEATAEVAQRKTASFFELAVATGWLVAGGEPEQVPVMRDIGRHVGMAYQLADDIRDMETDARRAAGGRPSWNFANLHGRVATGRELERYLRGARLLLAQCGLWTPLWAELCALIQGVAGSGPGRDGNGSGDPGGPDNGPDGGPDGGPDDDPGEDPGDPGDERESAAV